MTKIRNAIRHNATKIRTNSNSHETVIKNVRSWISNVLKKITEIRNEIDIGVNAIRNNGTGNEIGNAIGIGNREIGNVIRENGNNGIEIGTRGKGKENVNNGIEIGSENG